MNSEEKPADIQVINLVLALLRYAYPESMSPRNLAVLGSMTFIGIIVGQFGFGFLADLMGRR